MNIGRGKVLLIATLFAVVCSIPAFAQAPCGHQNAIYCQPFDGTGTAYSSQNDTTGGNGLFAQVYDNVTLPVGSGQDWDIEDIHFVGEYFNPPQQGQITGWHVQLYNDSGGQPGSLLAGGDLFFAGTGNETFLGSFGGFPTYTYDIDFGTSIAAAAGQTIWVSVFPDLGFPPQWGWSSGTGGDGLSYQDFFGTRSPLAADMAFELTGTQGGPPPVPEPGTLVMLGTGVLGLAGAIRRKIF